MSLIVTASILVLLIIIVILFLFHLEQVKYTKRLEDRIGVLSSRIRSMNTKELDTVLKSIEYKKERDELYEILENIDSTLKALEDGRQIKIMPKLPRTYLDKSNYLKTYKSYYTYNPLHDTPSQSNTQSDSTSSQDSSSYSGGGGDFSGGGSGGSWD